MASKRDYYEVLGVSKTATDEELKKAWKASDGLKGKKIKPEKKKVKTKKSFMANTLQR